VFGTNGGHTRNVRATGRNIQNETGQRRDFETRPAFLYVNVSLNTGGGGCSRSSSVIRMPRFASASSGFSASAPAGSSAI